MEHAYSFLWSILYLQQTNILCYEVFECNDIREIIAAHFLKKVRWLSWKYFLTNYRAQHEFRSERNLKKLAFNDLFSTKKRFKRKSALLLFSPLRVHQILQSDKELSIYLEMKSCWHELKHFNHFVEITYVILSIESYYSSHLIENCWHFL